jgi:hypothetical protein
LPSSVCLLLFKLCYIPSISALQVFISVLQTDAVAALGHGGA